jgi:hypothetical protein
MVSNRMMIVLGGCLLTASAAWADDLGYVDCRNHPEETQVFAKARQTHEVVASLPCGERFAVLQYGFIFSRIQTGNGKVGYVYSNLIAPDHSGAVLRPSASAQLSAATSNVAITTAPAVQPNPAPPAQSQAAPVQPAPPPEPAAATSNASSKSVTDIQANPTIPTQTQPPSYQPAAIQPAANTTSVPETPATPIQPAPIAPAQQPQGATTQLAATETTPPAASVPELSPTLARPDATPAAVQPEPAPTTTAAPTMRSASARESWEKPNPGVRTVGPHRLPLIELFGGYSFARFDNGGGTASNLSGGLGSFGWNVKPWVQIVADTSYNVVTVSGTKNVLYGNHYGPRFFGRTRNRWGITPFVEGLVGGSRADTTVSGTGGYKTSVNSISYKLGGGIDMRPSRHIEIRLFDVDYYRTSFGTNLQQNNYWASTGIVIRLFGGSE